MLMSNHIPNAAPSHNVFIDSHAQHMMQAVLNKLQDRLKCKFEELFFL